MIKIITNKKHVTEGKLNICIDVNSFFDNIVSEVGDITTFITDKDFEYLGLIDGVKFMKDKYVETKFGATHI